MRTTPRPDVIHYLSDDGLALHSYYDGDALIEGTAVWPDAETAEDRVLDAVAAFEERLDALIVSAPSTGKRRSRYRRLGPFSVTVHRPERWWLLPRLHVSRTRRRVTAAWGPAGVSVTLGR